MPKSEPYLLSCPFCGGRPVLAREGGLLSYFVYCLRCRAETATTVSQAAARNIWNRRVNDGVLGGAVPEVGGGGGGAGKDAALPDDGAAAGGGAAPAAAGGGSGDL